MDINKFSETVHKNILLLGGEIPTVFLRDLKESTTQKNIK